MNRAFKILLIMICVLFFSCVKEKKSETPNENNSSDTYVSIVDDLGREVKVKSSVKRIIYNHYATAEALKILSSWDRVVGRDSFNNDSVLFPGIQDIPIVVPPNGNPYSDANIEKIITLKGDLFICEVIPMPGIEELISKLEGIIPVVCLTIHDPETLISDIDKLGHLLGKEDESREYIEWYEGILKKLTNKTDSLSANELPSLFYKTGFGGIDELYAFTNTLKGIPFRNKVVGCKNVTGDLPSKGGWVGNIDKEWIIKQQIDVLIIGDAMSNAYGINVTDKKLIVDHREEVMKLPYFSNSNAVKKNRVYMFSPRFIGAPSYIIGYAYLAKWLHPELFTQLSPPRIHQEYLKRFMQVDVDLNKTGVFVYPEE
jgi:iron complex transport system substrate-binding protein